MLRILITGVAGFAGSHLADYAAALGGVEIHGIAHRDNDLTVAGLPPTVTIHVGDLTDKRFTADVVGEVRPDRLFHLAAQASIGASWSDPVATFTNNVVSQLSVLDAVVERSPESRVLSVGSADAYGLVRPDELPISEDQPFRPMNPYAVSKITQDMLALQYHLAKKLDVVRVRPFNHIGPRQRDDFVASAFARQVAEAEVNLRPPVIRVGNLDASRDFTDVRDVVRAYWLLLEKGKPGEVYNVCSGRAVVIRELLEMLVAQSQRKLSVETDPARQRPTDVPVLMGDSTRLREATGWVPERNLAETLTDLLQYWRGRVQENRI